MYEKSAKGLSHALTHATENLECAGHHGAYNTAVPETAHKHNIKIPATFAKTYGCYNKSQEVMLNYALFETLCKQVIALNKYVICARRPPVQKKKGKKHLKYKLSGPLPYTNGWPSVPIRGTQFPANWRSTFLSKEVIVQFVRIIVFFTCL